MLEKQGLKNIIICLFFWLAGGGIALLTIEPVGESTLKDEFNTVVTPSFVSALSTFRHIFIHNIWVALLLSMGGFFTFGIMALLVSVWNGFMISLIIQYAALNHSLSYIGIHLLHAPFEILSLLMFGAIGLRGFHNIKKIRNQEPFSFADLPKIRHFRLPFGLLFLAAILESLSYVYQI